MLNSAETREKVERESAKVEELGGTRTSLFVSPCLPAHLLLQLFFVRCDRRKRIFFYFYAREE